jgi:transcriptional regulator with XRE-family HTH domain
MANAQLYAYLKDQGFTLADIAERTGYNYTYLSEMLSGREKLSDAARFRFIEAFPDTAQFLLPKAAFGELTEAVQL